MTMQNAPHPDDELLAAFAGADRDALADQTLTDHLASCDRCSGLVEELTFLRSALSELPDLAPSRPLQLLPPVPAPVQRGASAWLRRLVAPVVATGAGLLLVGAVGTAGLLGRVSLFSAAAASPGQETSAGDSAFGPAVNPAASQGSQGTGSLSAGSPRQSPSDRSNDGTGNGVDSGPPPAPAPAAPWNVLLIAGAGFVLTGVLLRYTLEPRAG
jgi:hypothetical protein